MGDDDCAICLEACGAHCSTLPCGHVFHSRCILQSCMHDPRCPVCRAAIAERVAPHQTIVRLSLDDLEEAIERDFSEIRAQQLRYDGRRRRFVNAREHLRAEKLAIKELDGRIRALEQQISARWAEETRALWSGDKFRDLRRLRALLMQRRRRRQRTLDREVVDALGERPDIDFDDAEVMAAVRF
jgi:hypothetical protein